MSDSRGSNTGVYPPSPSSLVRGSGSKYDWYSSTVHAHPELVLEAIREAVERELGGPATLQPGSFNLGYKRAQAVCDRSGVVVATVLDGGSNPFPHVVATGSMAPLLARVLAERGNHRPARIDVAIDRSGPGLAARWFDLCERLGKQYGVGIEQISAPIDPDAGTTVYLGARKSQIRLRVYEKGLERAKKEGLAKPIPDAYRHWVRAEITFRPKKIPAKIAAAHMEPDAFWGCNQWLIHFAEEALSMQAELVQLRERRESNYDRAIRAMAHQYRAHIEELWRRSGRVDATAFKALRALADIEDFSVQSNVSKPCSQGV